jgi:hypothetical protein
MMGVVSRARELVLTARRSLFAAVLAVGATLLVVAPALAANTTPPGLLQVTAKVVSGYFSLCSGEFKVAEQNETTTVSRQATCPTMDVGPNEPSSLSFTISEAPGRAQLSYDLLPASGDAKLLIMYGGNCETDGVVTIQSSGTRSCTADIYEVAHTVSLAGAGSQRAQRPVDVTETVVGRDTDPDSVGPTDSVVCAVSWRIGILEADGKLSPESDGLKACTDASASRSGDSESVSGLVEVGASPTARLGVSDSFSTAGYITTYSDGCDPSTDAGEIVPGHVIRACTITHTQTANKLPPGTASAGLLGIEADQVGGAPTLCAFDLEITSTAKKPTTTPLCAQGSAAATSGAGAGKLTSAQLSLAVPSGQLKLAVIPGSKAAAPGSESPSSLAANTRVVLGGDCKTDGTVKLAHDGDVSCTVTIYPSKTVSLAPNGTGRTVTITERLAGAVRPSDDSDLCEAHLDIGVAQPTALNPKMTTNICTVSDQRTVGLAQALTVTNDYSVKAGSDSAIGVDDSFDTAGFVTTYGSGCAPTPYGAARIERASVETCTVSHTLTDNKLTGKVGLVDVEVAADGTGNGDFSVCASKLVASGAGGKQLASVKPDCTNPASGRGASPPASFMVALPAGKATLSLVPDTNSTNAPTIVGSGDCEPSGTVDVLPFEAKSCTLTAYPVAATRGLGGSSQGLIQVTDVVDGVRGGVSVTSAAMSPAYTDLCSDSYSFGIINAAGQLSQGGTSVDPCKLKGSMTTTADGGGGIVTIVQVNRSVGAKVGLADVFGTSGFVTTYSGDCGPVSATAVKVTFHAGIADCTITHTLPIKSTTTTGPPASVPPPSPTPSATASTTSANCANSVAGDPIEVADSMHCTITVTASGAAPAGTVTVTPGNETCTLSSGSCAVSVPTGASAGTLKVGASYPGQSGIAASTGSTNVAVALRSTGTAMSCQSAGLANGSANAGQPITCVLAVNDTYGPSAYTPDGSVSATANGTTQTCTLSATTKSCTVTFSSGLASSATISSSYAGDGTEFAASTASDPITVNVATMTSVSCASPYSTEWTIEVDDAMQCDVTVTASGGATPTGTVTVTPGNETCTLSSGSCDVNVSTGSTVETLDVGAAYPAQTGFQASSGPDDVPVALRQTDIAMDCSSAGLMDGNANANAPIICALTVEDLYSPPENYTPPGSVSATANGNTQTCTLNSTTKSCTVTFSSGLPSSQTITSHYAGNGTEFAPSNASDPISVT